MWSGSTDEFQYKKYTDYFRYLDRDNSGTIEQADFLMAAKFLEEHQGSSGAVKAQLAFWNELTRQMSKGVEDVITHGEFVDFFYSLAARIRRAGKAPPWAIEFIQRLLETLDLDNNGSISTDEFAIYLKSLGSDADPEVAFKYLDRNGDGQLSLDEVEDMFVDWITMRTPNMPGNWLVTGRIPE